MVNDRLHKCWTLGDALLWFGHDNLSLVPSITFRSGFSFFGQLAGLAWANGNRYLCRKEFADTMVNYKECEVEGGTA
jgi:hypothetical protein